MLGILYIVFCCCTGFVGKIMGIVGLVLSSKAHVIYEANPNAYTLSSYNNLKGGKVCSIIGLCLSSLALIYFIIYAILVGSVIGMLGPILESQY